MIQPIKSEEFFEKRIRFFLDKEDTSSLIKTGIQNGFLNEDLRFKCYQLLLSFDPFSSKSDELSESFLT